MNARGARIRKWKLAWIVALSGGILPGKCEIRLKESFIDAGKSTFASLFDPEQLAGWFGLDQDTP
ncbi:MAG: hypothetical protein IT449_15010 [Phycisphaerales bacterium]|nr:hypothetical protein [Phycisphaerales bacterium]